MTGWRTSSHSFSNGNCVEVASWRKPSRSAAGNCAEIAATGTSVLVRDTKQDGTGPVLRFAPASWAAFVAAVKDGAAQSA